MLLHGILQCAVGHHLFNQNHRGAMMELGEGLRKLRLNDDDNATTIPFCRFQEEVAAAFNFIYRTQKEFAACTDDLCLTMDGSISPTSCLATSLRGSSFTACSCKQKVLAAGDGGEEGVEVALREGPVGEHRLQQRVVAPRVHVTAVTATGTAGTVEYLIPKHAVHSLSRQAGSSNFNGIPALLVPFATATHAHHANEAIVDGALAPPPPTVVAPPLGLTSAAATASSRHGNHRGAMMELGEGLRKLRLNDDDNATTIPFCRFQEEVAAAFNFIYRTQKEFAACTDDLCLTMDGSISPTSCLATSLRGSSFTACSCKQKWMMFQP
uniref:Uncharacterized protein n=1 Tax=Oryza brachyantha TaxID=4533 RepID=J3NB22_ORYBR